MDLLDLLQLLANAALLAISADALRLMRRSTPMVRAGVFLFIAFCAAFGILAALSRVPDANADALLALGATLLMLVGCRPITRMPK